MKKHITRRSFMGGALGAAALAMFSGPAMADLVNFNFLRKKGASFPYALTEAQWREKLGAQQYAIMRDGNNEDAGTSRLLREHRKGTYLCRGCDRPLFSSAAKVMANDYVSFRNPVAAKAIGTSADFGIVLPRTEVHCKNCGSHLGYRFQPQDTGDTWRYAINGTSLTFQPA